MKTKICTKCNKEKDVDLFGKHKKTKSGLRSHCKECEKEYAKKWNLNNPEKVKENDKKWHLNNPEKLKETKKNYTNELGKGYLNSQLRSKGFKKEQITPELLEVQKIIIKTKRLCKTSQN